MVATSWDFNFLVNSSDNDLTSATKKRALIVLNQPFSRELLNRVWGACQWRACADGGANRLYDLLENNDTRLK